MYGWVDLRQRTFFNVVDSNHAKSVFLVFDIL